jgi:hypothetical protein
LIPTLKSSKFISQPCKQLALAPLNAEKVFLGVIIGLPYLHGIWHPQSIAGAGSQSIFNIGIKLRLIIFTLT